MQTRRQDTSHQIQKIQPTRSSYDDATMKLYLRTLTIYIVYYTMNEKELGSYVDMMKVTGTNEEQIGRKHL